MSENDIPVKRAKNSQVENEIDQREVDGSDNKDPTDFRIDSAKLFTQATEQTRMALCVSDPFQDDCPIIYANQAFTDLTGYNRDEVVGRNCRFLQGEDTDPKAVERIRIAMENQDVVVVDILNYRKDGTTFWNALHVGPIFTENGDLAYFYGSQWDITKILNARSEAIRQEQIAEELQHRTNNLFAIISSIVSLTARGETDAQEVAAKVNERIIALSHAHKASIAPGGRVGKKTDLATLINAVLGPYRTNLEGRVKLAGEPFELPRDQVTPVGLALHELATNSVKYGSLSVISGEVCIDWSGDDEALTICWLEKNGPKVATQSEDRGIGQGARLIEGALRGAGGEIDHEFREDGVCATIKLKRQD